MAQTFKKLGSIYPSANTQTNVYVVPAATEVVVSTLSVCNQTNSNASFSIAIMSASEFNSPAPNSSFLIRGSVVPAADSLLFTIGLTANTGSVIAANTNIQGVSFMLFGSEIS